MFQSASESVLGAGGDERLEPPLAETVETEHVVVVRQVEIGEANRTRRAFRQVLDETAEPIPQPPEPAAADRGLEVTGRADIGDGVHERKRVGVGISDR